MLNSILKEAERREAEELERAARKKAPPILQERLTRMMEPPLENPERPDMSRFAPNFHKNGQLDFDVLSLCVNLAAGSGILYTTLLLLTGDFFRGYVILAFSLVLLLLNGIHRNTGAASPDKEA